MRFCSMCGNMYYTQLTDKSLSYYCRNCGNTEDIVGTRPECVSKTHLKQTEQTFANVINPYTKLDPTLPRVSNILCPNAECPTNTHAEDTPREVILIRYDHANMLYVNLCTTCDTVWRPGG